MQDNVTDRSTVYLASSLDKSNLGNAKSLGMMKDLGHDPKGETYALLSSLYYVSYAPFSQYHHEPHLQQLN
jgi:hypothetical protein